MKLIDILNLIAKGELKYGTKFLYREQEFVYVRSCIINKTNGKEFVIYGYDSLNEEVEMIGNDTNVDTKIEEIDTEFLRYTFECEGTFRPVKAITSLGDKLNEVIRELNRRSEWWLRLDSVMAHYAMI